MGRANDGGPIELPRKRTPAPVVVGDCANAVPPVVEALASHGVVNGCVPVGEAAGEAAGAAVPGVPNGKAGGRDVAAANGLEAMGELAAALTPPDGEAVSTPRSTASCSVVRLYFFLSLSRYRAGSAVTNEINLVNFAWSCSLDGFRAL